MKRPIGRTCSTLSCLRIDLSKLFAGLMATFKHVDAHLVCSEQAREQLQLSLRPRLGDRVGAVVSRGGRPDLARDLLDLIHTTPTLLIVGGVDYEVIKLNEHALARLKGPKALEIVPGASHLFPEPGTLEAVIGHASRWFTSYLASPQ